MTGSAIQHSIRTETMVGVALGALVGPTMTAPVVRRALADPARRAA